MSTVQNSTNASYAAQWQYLQALQSSQASGGDQSGSSVTAAKAFDPFAGLGDDMPPQGGSAACPPLSLGTMSALINAQAQAGGNASGLSNYQQKIFGELDADGDGKVTSAELTSAFGSQNADASKYVMGKLDTDGDGAITQSEFGAGTTRGPGGHHHHHMQGMGGGQGARSAQPQDPLQQLLAADGANSQTTSNSDGSNTTTITYADGSKVSMTSAASSSSSDASGNATSNSTQQNLLEQLIKMQSQLLQSVSATSATSSLATI